MLGGPGSALYGSDALLGIAIIVTGDDLNDVDVGVGGHGLRDAEPNLSSSLGPLKASVLLSSMRDDGESFTDLSSPDLVPVKDPRESLTEQIVLKTDSSRLDARLARFNLDDFYVLAVTPSVPGSYYRARDG